MYIDGTSQLRSGGNVPKKTLLFNWTSPMDLPVKGAGLSPGPLDLLTSWQHCVASVGPDAFFDSRPSSNDWAASSQWGCDIMKEAGLPHRKLEQRVSTWASSPPCVRLCVRAAVSRVVVDV